MKLKRGILKEHSSLLSGAMHFLDWIVVAFSGIIAETIYIGDGLHSPSYVNVIIMSVFIAGMLFPRFNLYRTWRGAPLLDELRLITVAWLSVMGVLAVVAFLTKTGPEFSRGWGLIWLGIGWSLLSSGRIILRLLLRFMRKCGYNQRRVVIVGWGELSDRLVNRIVANPWIGLKIICVFDAKCGTSKLHGKISLDELEPFIVDNYVDQVWISLPFKEEDTLLKILHILRHSTVDIRFVPDIFGLRLLNHSITEVAGIPVISLTSTPMEGHNRIFKAIEDRSLAMIILFLISPLVLFISILIKLTSPGPVLFRQKRHGWDGREFTVLKFRTMYVHNDVPGVVMQAKKNDMRITPIGKFLRKSSIDEFPQFINVLKGDMSIVGPRPHALEHNEFYKELVDQYMLRHKMKPGITGWAQVNGYRGETDTLEKMQKRVEYDLYYIEHWSLWLDFKIIIMTIFKGFVNKNAY